MRRSAAVIAMTVMLVLPTLGGCTGRDDTQASSSKPRTSPAPSEPPPSPTETHTPVGPVLRNGRITSAERYLDAKAPGYSWRSFDPTSGTALFVTAAEDKTDRDFAMDGLSVVKPTGRVATLTCARDLRCSGRDNWLGYPATLGPGADEVTVASGSQTAQVLGYDGTLRRTLDLAAIPDDESVSRLAWSHDGGHLAVTTYRANATSLGRAHVWLVDGVEGAPVIAYVGRRPSSVMGNPQWSPDGQSLLLDLYVGTTVGTDVVVLRLQPEGASDPVIAQRLYRSNRHFDWAGNLAWSPDGTRIAVRTRSHITEISAEDGRVLAQHPHDDGWLIWTARKP